MNSYRWRREYRPASVVMPEWRGVIVSVPLEPFTEEEIEECVRLGMERDWMDRLNEIVREV